jgi:YidC/Oxa1 family membrane protein insertase
MSHSLFTTILIQPIYNAFIFLISVIPGGNAGFAIIVLTLFLRLVFYPTFSQAMRTQYGMRRIEGEMEEIKEKYKNDAAERGRKTMELMKANNVRPFMSFLAVLIQLPVFIALYIVFLREGFPAIAHELLYTFTPVPQAVGIVFLGVLNLTVKHNIALTLLVAAAQYFQARVAQSGQTLPAKITPERAQMLAMQKNMMIYFLPLLMGSVAFSLPGAAGLYLLTNTLASLAQEIVVRRKFVKEASLSPTA